MNCQSEERKPFSSYSHRNLQTFNDDPTTTKTPEHSHAKAQRSRNICLPVGTIEHEDARETTEKYPIGVSTHLH